MTMPTPDRSWSPDAALAILVALVGVLEVLSLDGDAQGPGGPHLLLALTFAVGVGLSRRAPAVGLLVVWAACAVQLLGGVSVLLSELCVVVLAFGCARWGRPATLVLSGLSIAASAAVLVLLSGSVTLLTVVYASPYRRLFGATREVVSPGQVVAVGLLLLTVPWLSGLVARSAAGSRQARRSQQAAEQDAAQAVLASTQAQDIARLREDQARLANDVHDVVGHSLAVILAQAEAGQYLTAETPDALADRLRTTMATIATSARSSLGDVRQVLTAGREAATSGGLDALVDGVARTGRPVSPQVFGSPRPLPPELAEVAFRVLQEMLTNAVRHGGAGAPVLVEQHWPDGGSDDLRLEVRNAVAPGEAAGVEGDQGGAGLPGMRRRLESVGGRLDVRRREQDGVVTFTVTAWVPVRVR